jgi:tRNA G26 N,N-dimethylase Trm1
MREEVNEPAFYYKMDTLAKLFHVEPPPVDRMIVSLKRAGYQASRTHFESNGFRTTASVDDLTRLIKIK